MNKYDEKTNLEKRNHDGCDGVENCVAGADGTDGTNCADCTNCKSVSGYEPDILTENALELTVTEIIRKLRIPARVHGYSYVRTAIMLSVEQPELLHKVTTALYPTIAEKYGTTPSRVERAIRHAIEVAWENDGYGAMCTYFGYALGSEYDKPSNSELIALVCDEIRVGRDIGNA